MPSFDITAVIKAQDQASNELSKVGRSTDKLGGKFQKLGKTASIAAGFIAANLIAGAGSAITNFVRGGIESFLSMQEAMLILKSAVESQGGDWADLESQVTESLENMELETATALPVLAESMAKLLRAGVPQEDVFELLKGLVGTAEGVGRDLGTVIDTFSDAIATDSISSLQKFGVDLLDIAENAGVKFSKLDLAKPLRELAKQDPDLAADLEAGFDGSEESARALVDTLLGLGIEIEDLDVDILEFVKAIAASYVDLAEKGDSLAESIAKQNAEMEQAQRQLGEVAAPFQLMWINFVSGFLADIPKMAEDWAAWVNGVLLVFESLGDSLGIVMVAIQKDFTDMIDTLINAAKNLWKTLVGGSIWTDTFDKMASIEKKSLNTITQDVEAKMPIIAAGAAAISGAVQTVTINGPLTTIQGNPNAGDLERSNRIAIRQITRGVRQ